MDWEKIAGPSEDEEEEEEEDEEAKKPIKVDVSEVLKRVRKPSKKIEKSHAKRVNKKGKL